MGTEVTLDIAGLSISYAKNHRGPDHGSLFQDTDRVTIPEDGSGRGNNVHDHLSGAALMRPLSDIVPRLKLLGYNMDRARAEYARAAHDALENRKALQEEDSVDTQAADVMPFDEFRSFVAGITIADLDDTYIHDNNSDSERRRIFGRFDDEEFKARIPRDACMLYDDSEGWSERSHFGTLVEFLDPYTLLILLADNPQNRDAPVLWCYGPLVEAGWADAGEFVPGAQRHEKFLIATEGSSDVHIIIRAIEMLRPAVADFFRFVDVSESHPFSGVGRMVTFAEGLKKIDVHNRVLFVLDNDAEGVSGLARIEKMGLPANMRALTLPTPAALWVGGCRAPPRRVSCSTRLSRRSTPAHPPRAAG